MNFSKRLLTSLLFFSIFCTVFAHDFYVSICQIDDNVKSKSLEITFKLFTDDFERVLEAVAADTFKLSLQPESKQAHDVVSKYILKNFSMEIDGEERKPEFIGFEVEVDITWCYVEVKRDTIPTNLSIRNTILFDLSDRQTNIVHVQVGDTLKSLLLHKDKERGSVRF